MKKALAAFGIYDRKSFIKTVVQFLKFSTVGLSNLFVNLAVYYFVLFVGFNHYIANFCGFLVSVINAFIWNYFWVFKDSSSSGRAGMIAKFSTIYVFTYLLSNLWLYIFVDVMGVSNKLAPIIITAINTPINFALSKLWAFKNRG